MNMLNFIGGLAAGLMIGLLTGMFLAAALGSSIPPRCPGCGLALRQDEPDRDED